MKNGWVGLGWSLDLGFIQRATKYSVCYTCNDFIVTSIGSTAELVQRDAEWGTDYYGTRVEGGFTKYYNDPTGGWVATSRDGTKYYYGSTLESRQTNQYGIFKWCLDKVVDSNGNYMEIQYNNDGFDIYPELIEYTGNINGPPEPANSVRFHLDPTRPDATSMFTTNAEVKTAKRLKSIEIRADGDLVRAYKLEYSESSSTRRSLLQSIQQYGNDATVDEIGNISGSNALPKVNYEYSLDEEGTFPQAFYTTSGIGEYNLGSDRDRAFPFDYNGDGLSDIFLYRPNTGVVGVVRSQGDGTFEEVYHSYTGIVGYDLMSARDRAFPLDYNGDGKSDIFLYRPDSGWACVARSNGDGTFSPAYLSYSGIADYDLRSLRDRAFSLDHNGDG